MDLHLLLCQVVKVLNWRLPTQSSLCEFESYHADLRKPFHQGATISYEPTLSRLILTSTHRIETERAINIIISSGECRRARFRNWLTWKTFNQPSHLLGCKGPELIDTTSIYTRPYLLFIPKDTRARVGWGAAAKGCSYSVTPPVICLPGSQRFQELKRKPL